MMSLAELDVDIERGLYLCEDLAGTIMSPEEFDAVESCDEAHVYELINGVLVVSSLPSEGQRGSNDELGFLLRDYRKNNPNGADLDETLPESHIPGTSNRRRADRAIWTGLGRVPNPHVDVPSIVIEIVSKGKRNRRRDYTIKRDEYLGVGVQEYWAIDRFDRTMTVYQKSGQKTAETVVGESDAYATPLLPGFELSLAEILKEADRWGQLGFKN